MCVFHVCVFPRIAIAMCFRLLYYQPTTSVVIVPESVVMVLTSKPLIKVNDPIKVNTFL